MMGIRRTRSYDDGHVDPKHGKTTVVKRQQCKITCVCRWDLTSLALALSREIIAIVEDVRTRQIVLAIGNLAESLINSSLTLLWK
jgi:hypothetical protein